MSANNTTGATVRVVLLSVVVLLSAVAVVPISGGEGEHADEQNAVFESFDVEFASANPEAPPDVTVQWELAEGNEDIDEIQIAVTNESDEPINLYKPGDTNVPNPFVVSTDDAGNGSADIVVENLASASLTLKIPAGHCARVDTVRASADSHGNGIADPPDVLREVNCSKAPGAGAFSVAIDEYDESVTAGEYANVSAEIENTGDVEESQDIRFLADGNAVAVRENMTLSGNRSETVSFSYETGEKDAPEFEIAVESDDETANRTVEVIRPEPPFFAVAIENAPSQVTAGEAIELVVQVENTGGYNAIQNVTVADLDGDVVDSSPPIELAPDEATNVSLNWSTESADAGVGNVTVRSENDTDTAEIDIRPATVESITATLNETEVTVGEDTSVTVEATFTNGSALNVTDSATLESLNTTVATVSANGTVLAETNGTAEIEATFRNETDRDVLSVQAPEPANNSSEEDGSGSDDSSSEGDSSNGGDDGSDSESDDSGSGGSGGSDAGGGGGGGSDFDDGGVSDEVDPGDGGSDTATSGSGSGSRNDGSGPEGDGSGSENDSDDSDSGSDDVGEGPEAERDGSGSGSIQDRAETFDDSAPSVVVSPVVGWPLVLLPLLMARDWSLGR